MGRTLHYTVTNAQTLSEKEKEIIVEVSKTMNSGAFTDVWTCENFYLDPLSFYPNLANPIIKSCGEGHESAWEFVEKELTRMQSLGLSLTKAKEILIETKIVNLHNEDKSIEGFTKVGGNEYNALLVLLACVAITERTSAEITLSDEGEFLIVPIELKGGKARADQEAWADGENYKQKAEDLIDFALAHRKYSTPSDFHRSVNPADFAKHGEYSAGEIMAGFHGEYFGLTTRDPEIESYKMLGKITNALGKHEGLTVEVASKI